MKLMLALLGLFFLNKPDPSLLVLDKNLKKPIQKSAHFTADQYLQKYFPVYASEVSDLISSADVAVKLMDKELPCHTTDTFSTAHTMIVVMTDCEELPNVSVHLTTKLEEDNNTFGYMLVSKEKNWRRAQQRLLDFATYIDQ